MSSVPGEIELAVILYFFFGVGQSKRKATQDDTLYVHAPSLLTGVRTMVIFSGRVSLQTCRHELCSD